MLPKNVEDSFRFNFYYGRTLGFTPFSFETVPFYALNKPSNGRDRLWMLVAGISWTSTTTLALFLFYRAMFGKLNATHQIFSWALATPNMQLSLIQAYFLFNSESFMRVTNETLRHAQVTGRSKHL